MDAGSLSQHGYLEINVLGQRLDQDVYLIGTVTDRAHKLGFGRRDIKGLSVEWPAAQPQFDYLMKPYSQRRYVSCHKTYPKPRHRILEADLCPHAPGPDYENTPIHGLNDRRIGQNTGMMCQSEFIPNRAEHGRHRSSLGSSRQER